MKSILVIGSGGFVGKALVEKLQDQDNNIIELGTEWGDIADIILLNRFKDTEISHVFHLASRTFVPDSWEKPVEFYKTSVIGTGQVLELCRAKECSLTYVSAYLYGMPDCLPISEKMEIKANNPYAHSKYLTEQLCRFYSEYYGVKVSIARPFNIYGAKQKGAFLIPHIINQVLDKRISDIQVKDLTPRRDYIYINDLVSGLVQTMKSREKFSIFNFGSGYSLSVEEVIQVIQNEAGTNKNVTSDYAPRRNEINEVIADCKYAQQALGWEPKFSFGEGIRKILEEIGNGK